jgi:D-alanyl-D-alanine dipeptidase
MKKLIDGLIYSLLLIPLLSLALPKNFVYLSEIDPSIVQEIRYAGEHNFMGRPVQGYLSATCILTKEAAFALKKIQTELRKQNYSLKVYDCYRPNCAVKDFLRWSQRPDENKMKAEFYPRIEKNKLFSLGYIAKRSSHSRGSTVDLTLISLKNNMRGESYSQSTALRACYAPWSVRFRDNSLDMGTGYDCLDKTAHIGSKAISPQAIRNRLFLMRMMTRYGFRPYKKEWWHFTLKNEPHKKINFNFRVE